MVEQPTGEAEQPTGVARFSHCDQTGPMSDTELAEPIVEGTAKQPDPPFDARSDIVCSLSVGGVECALVPVAAYEALRKRAGEVACEKMTNDPLPAFRSGSSRSREFARRLRAARRRAGLSQRELALRLGRSQATVCHGESGTGRVGVRYVRAVLEACGFPPNWEASPDDSRYSRDVVPEGLATVATPGCELTDETAMASMSGWDLLAADVAGLDPETFAPVRKGSPRDLELREKLEWWRRRSDP
jgi:transcriptional regulator with XRE-family HTH domain